MDNGIKGCYSIETIIWKVKLCHVCMNELGCGKFCCVSATCRAEKSTPVTANFSASFWVVCIPDPQPSSSTSAPLGSLSSNTEVYLARTSNLTSLAHSSCCSPIWPYPSATIYFRSISYSIFNIGSPPYVTHQRRGLSASAACACSAILFGDTSARIVITFDR